MLTAQDVLVTSSGHEGAVRKGVTLLGTPTIGCAAHALQLACKHAMPALIEEQVQEGIGVAAVLDPVRRATDLVQGSGERSLGSVYILVWHQLTEDLHNPKHFPVPTALRERKDQRLTTKNLPKRALALAKFLESDLNKIRQQHFASTAGEDWLFVATYVDPRFKGLTYCAPARLEKTRKQVVELCVAVGEKFPQLLLQHWENKTLATLVDQQPAKKKRRTSASAKTASAYAVYARATLDLPHGAAPLTHRRLKVCKSDEDWLRGKEPIISADAGGQWQKLQSLSEKVNAELAAYDAQPAQELSVSPLSWWSSFQHRSAVPHMSRVAQMALSTPASTADSERLFSAAGVMIASKRPRLSSRSASR